MAAPAVRFDPATLVRLNTTRVLRAARALKVAVARADAATFNELVLRDEQTGKSIALAPVHYEWHEKLDSHDRIVMWSHVEAGKTNQISVGRSLWRLGKDPNRRIVVVSKTTTLAKKIVRAAAQYIEKSEDLREVFPNLRPSSDRSMPWTADALTVERTGYAKDPSFQATSVHGTIVGSRIDTLVLDDILDYENTVTEYQRDKLWGWLNGTLIGRLTANAEVWALGNAFHPKDAMHRLAALPRYRNYKFPVLNANGHSSWPAVWPLTRIEGRRGEMTPAEFGRQMMCEARDESSGRFAQEWISKALELGDGYELIEDIPVAEAMALESDGYIIIHGVDLASSKDAKSDLTVIFSILVWPSGKYQVLRIISGRWFGPEIVDKLDQTHRDFGGTFVVENNAAQSYILQFAEKLTPADIVPFRTGSNKVNPDFGVESIGADMVAGRWIVPNTNGRTGVEVDAWIREMLFFDPKRHTGDRLMAGWFARELARARLRDREGRSGGSGVGVRSVG